MAFSPAHYLPPSARRLHLRRFPHGWMQDSMKNAVRYIVYGLFAIIIVIILVFALLLFFGPRNRPYESQSLDDRCKSWPSSSETWSTSYLQRRSTATGGQFSEICQSNSKRSVEDDGNTSVQNNRSFVVGGQPATKGQYPYIIYVEINNPRGACTGSLLDKTHVLTAAHCFLTNSTMRTHFSMENNDFFLTPDVYVTAGLTSDQFASQDNVNYQKVKARAIYVNSFFDDVFDYVFDIAVVLLKTPIEYNGTVRPVCLATENDKLPETCEVAGFGEITANGSLQDVYYLNRAVGLKYLTAKYCRSNFHVRNIIDAAYPNIPHRHELPDLPDKMRRLSEGKLCRQLGEDGKGTCFGDSGGPVLCGQGSSIKQFGVIESFIGTSCGEKNSYEFAGSVQYYHKWLEFVAYPMLERPVRNRDSGLIGFQQCFDKMAWNTLPNFRFVPNNKRLLCRWYYAYFVCRLSNPANFCKHLDGLVTPVVYCQFEELYNKIKYSKEPPPRPPGYHSRMTP